MKYIGRLTLIAFGLVAYICHLNQILHVFQKMAYVPIYLDNNATTETSKEAVELISQAYRELWQNPSSDASGAHKVKEAIERARGQVAEMVGADPKRSQEEIVFTSGGTEVCEVERQTSFLGVFK